MEAITTGPFIVPAAPIISALLIGLKNPTGSAKTVTVTVDRCAFPNTGTAFPNPVPETEGFFVQTVTLQPRTCRILTVTGFDANDILRVTVSGDISIEGGKVEVTVVGRRDSGRNEPTMFFRLADFVEAEEDDEDDDDDNVDNYHGKNGRREDNGPQKPDDRRYVDEDDI